MTEIRTLLHPTDFSDASERALALTQALAERLDARLHLIHVTQQLVSATTMDVGVIDSPDVSQATSAKLHELARDRDLEVRVAGCCALLGDPADRIISYARDNRIDLIVMGTHGRTGLKRLLVGSVARAVVSQAPCPVMVVPPARA